MTSIDITPIGQTVLPDDLVAPFPGTGCCLGPAYLVDIRDVINAAIGGAPMVCPSCGATSRPTNLELVAFVSRREWHSSDDPTTYFIGSAFRLPRVSL